MNFAELNNPARKGTGRRGARSFATSSAAHAFWRIDSTVSGFSEVDEEAMGSALAGDVDHCADVFRDLAIMIVLHGAGFVSLCTVVCGVVCRQRSWHRSCFGKVRNDDEALPGWAPARARIEEPMLAYSMTVLQGALISLTTIQYMKRRTVI